MLYVYSLQSHYKNRKKLLFSFFSVSKLMNYILKAMNQNRPDGFAIYEELENESSTTTSSSSKGLTSLLTSSSSREASDTITTSQPISYHREPELYILTLVEWIERAFNNLEREPPKTISTHRACELGNRLIHAPKFSPAKESIMNDFTFNFCNLNEVLLLGFPCTCKRIITPFCIS